MRRPAVGVGSPALLLHHRPKKQQKENKMRREKTGEGSKQKKARKQAKERTRHKDQGKEGREAKARPLGGRPFRDSVAHRYINIVSIRRLGTHTRIVRQAGEAAPSMPQRRAGRRKATWVWFNERYTIVRVGWGNIQNKKREGRKNPQGIQRWPPCLPPPPPPPTTLNVHRI